MNRVLFDVGASRDLCVCCRKREHADGQRRCERCILASVGGNGAEMAGKYGLSPAWCVKVENCVSGLRQRAKHKGQTKWATRADLARLLVQQQYRCAITGERLQPDATTVLGHDIPASKGGPATVGNLLWITKEANRLMGTMNREEFVRLCEQVTQHVRG